ncbi:MULTISPECIES: T9SS type A sorting domain-containing protein [unclassified Lacinutrix]
MKNRYKTMLLMLLSICSYAQTIDFSISFLGINSATNNYQIALIATPSSNMTNANTDDMVAAFYVPPGMTLGNFELGNSGIPINDWSSNSLGSNANGDAYYLARVEGGAFGTFLNGDGPFQLVLFDVITNPNPMSGSITFIENGDTILTDNFLENYININGIGNIYNQNDPSAKTINFSTLSLEDHTAIENELVVYPNPTSEYLNIATKHQIEQVEIFDLLGKKARTTKAKLIDVSTFQKGIYLVTITTKKGQITKRIVIQ